MVGHLLASLVVQRVKHLTTMRETWVWSLSGEESPREGNGNPLQYSCLENPMDEEVWWATVHGVTKSWTRLSDFNSLAIIILNSFLGRLPIFSSLFFFFLVGFYHVPSPAEYFSAFSICLDCCVWGTLSAGSKFVVPLNCSVFSL